LLSSWNIDFIPVNVHGNEAALNEMKKIGIFTPPAVVLGKRYVSGWNPTALADLMGVEYCDTPSLSIEELFIRLDRILTLAQNFIFNVPNEKLSIKKAGRDRVLRDLCFHTFRLSDAFVDAIEQGQFLDVWLEENAASNLQTGSDLSNYGNKVRMRLKKCSDRLYSEKIGRTISTDHGDQGVHLLLERTAWHAGQHLRQIYDLLAEHGIISCGMLDGSIFKGLPMPKEVW
jgi:hypothetical protein